MPELLDFDKDLVHLEAASKVLSVNNIFINLVDDICTTDDLMSLLMGLPTLCPIDSTKSIGRGNASCE